MCDSFSELMTRGHAARKCFIDECTFVAGLEIFRLTDPAYCLPFTVNTYPSTLLRTGTILDSRTSLACWAYDALAMRPISFSRCRILAASISIRPAQR